MTTARKTLLTVVAEAALEAGLCADILRLGAHGYTVTDARGSGSRGVRDASWSQAGNVRMEVVCERAVAERILDHLRATYYDDYAMIAMLSEVEVMRGGKF
jgi:hypothetical protein